MGTKKIGKHAIEITNEDKIIFPKDKITKGDIIEYYAEIADYMLPFMKDRPLTMERFPNGITHEGFYQKNMGDYFPSWIKGKKIKKQGGDSTIYVVCDNTATLVYLAQQLCLTPHLWLSKIDKLDIPDKMIFDLDPAGDDFATVRWTVKLLKDLLDDLGLPSFVMTTGSRGLHVVVPLKRQATYDAVRACARSIAEILVAQYPKKLTIQTSKKNRGSKLLIDYLRNGFGATAVAPFAVRAMPGAPVATPLLWKEINDKKLTSRTYTINNIFKRLSRVGDAWKNFNKSACSLTKVIKKLEAMSAEE